MMMQTESLAERDYFDLFTRHVVALTEHGPELRGLCPFHEDKNPSWTGNRHTGLWRCFGCSAQGNAQQFAERIGEEDSMGSVPPSRKIVATYDYHDEHGVLLYQVVRFEPKDFRQRKPDGKGGWTWKLNGVRRVLYRLPEILNKTSVFLVEGEKDADRLRALQLPATTCPGGAGKWREEFSHALRGKHVVILPDDDPVGEQHAFAGARSLLPEAASVRIVRLPSLSPKGDVSDWLDTGHTRDELIALAKATPILQPADLVERLVERWDAREEASAEPRPLPVPWPVLDEAALHGLAGEIVRTIVPYTEGDSVAVLLNFLTGFGNIIHSAAHCLVGKDRHPGNLNVLFVGDTAKGRKGTAWSLPRYLFSLTDSDWTRDCVKSGLSSAEGLIYHVRDASYKKQPVKVKGRVVDYESVMVEEAVEDKRLLIVEAEFASTLTVMNREGNTLSAVIRDAWDWGNLATLTRNSPLKATGAHISIIGHITRQELLARMDETSKANGFANRFLFALVRRSKELPEGGDIPEAELDDLATRLSEVILFSRAVSLVQRDEEAKALWAEIYHDLSEGKPGLIGSIIARAEAHVLRLSLLYALLAKSNVIKVEHLTAALALWDYCEKSAVLIFGERLGDPTADRILEAVRSAGTEGITDNEIVELFQRHKKSEELTRAKNLLLSLHLIQEEKEETGGRPRTRYALSGEISEKRV